jgi:ABC-2 type transport system ATP-binding protein
LDVVVHRQQAQAKIGYLPENGPLYHDMTVYDFSQLHRGPAGGSPEQRSRVLRDAMKKTDILPKAAQTIQTLSRGYRQRVGVTQALLHRPPILILDEPTNGLDPSQVQHMRTLIRELARESTVVLSTHILQEVDAVCSRVLIVANGRLVLDKNLSDSNRADAFWSPSTNRPPRRSRFWNRLRAWRPWNPRAIREENTVCPHPQTGGNTPLGPADCPNGLMEKGISVYSMAPERHDLETVFREANERPQEVLHA